MLGLLCGGKASTNDTTSLIDSKSDHATQTFGNTPLNAQFIQFNAGFSNQSHFYKPLNAAIFIEVLLGFA